MDTYTVSFFGHRYIDNPFPIEKALEELIGSLLQSKEYVEFLVGRNGDFDQLVFRTVFDPDRAETAEEMMIQDWYGCLYRLPEKSYLCWTAAPDISYVMEYDPSVVSDADIIRMAESAVPIEPTE